MHIYNIIAFTACRECYSILAVTSEHGHFSTEMFLKRWQQVVICS